MQNGQAQLTPGNSDLQSSLTWVEAEGRNSEAMEVTVTREEGRGLGLTFRKRWDGEEGLVLADVASGSAADHAGMKALESRVLRAVNGHRVATNSDFVSACRSSGAALTFAFDRRSPADGDTDPPAAQTRQTANFDSHAEYEYEKMQHNAPHQVPVDSQTAVHPYEDTELDFSQKLLSDRKRKHAAGILSKIQAAPPQRGSEDSRQVSCHDLARDIANHQPLHMTPPHRAEPAGSAPTAALRTIGLLQGEWTCGEGTQAKVKDYLVAFGAPPEAAEFLLIEGTEVVLLGASAVQVTDETARWSDGDVWKRKSAPLRGLHGWVPNDGNAAVLHRTGGHMLGLVWKGSSTFLHSVTPGSDADHSGFQRYVSRQVVSVNGIRIEDALQLSNELRAGALQGATELRFEFDSRDTNVVM
ncbi:hypothetical protein DIPPA_08743 [Diplonema papillatum]|nr:hypothetical protein DIPPA_08743 [Diplonema papillatum]KAJ9460283.1 hypothetical protein DIPPA_08743 [Diplonema papillatum]